MEALAFMFRVRKRSDNQIKSDKVRYFGRSDKKSDKVRYFGKIWEKVRYFH